VAPLKYAGMEPIRILCDARTPASVPGERLQTYPAWEIGNAASMDSLARAVSNTDPHVLVIQHHPGFLPWPDLTRLLNDRRVRDRIAVVTLHIPAHLFDIGEEERLAVLDALRGVSRVLVHRIEDLNLLKGLGLISNVTLFPQGVPPLSERAPAGALTPKDAPVIGCYGFFTPGKAISRLIEAVAQLRQTWPQLRLRLVNARHPFSSSQEIFRCEKLARQLGLSDAIEWETSFLPYDMSMQLLAGCDLVVLPYDESRESSSAALRSALASGVPVAVTPVAIFQEAEDAVYRFDAVDASSVAAGIDLLLRNPEMRENYRKAAIRWAANRSWDMLARRFYGMLVGLHANHFSSKESDAARERSRATRS